MSKYDNFDNGQNTLGARYNVIGYNGFLGPNETFSTVFHLIITVLQYNSQNAEVPMELKQPGPTTFYQ